MGQQTIPGTAQEKIPGLHELAERYLTQKEDLRQRKEVFDETCDRLVMKMHSIERTVYECDGVRVEVEDLPKLRVKTVAKKKS